MWDITLCIIDDEVLSEGFLSSRSVEVFYTVIIEDWRRGSGDGTRDKAGSPVDISNIVSGIVVAGWKIVSSL